MKFTEFITDPIFHPKICTPYILGNLRILEPQQLRTVDTAPPFSAPRTLAP